MYNDYAPLLSFQPIAHASHDVRDNGEGRWVMVGERVVVYAIVYFAVWIASAFGTKLPDCPVLAMLRVEELDERIEGVSVCALRVGAAGA